MVVIYSTRTGRVRRIISDEVRSEAKLEALFPPGVGEASIRAGGATLEEIQEAVSDLTGLVPTNDRVAVVDSNGIVVAAIMADHVIDSSSAGVLVAHAEAQIGWRRMLDGSWQRSLAEIDSELTSAQDQRDVLDSAAFRDDSAASPNGLTKGEIDTAITSLDVKITSLSNERVDRLAVR